MNEVDIKALADKREGNIQKLISYLNAGKTVEEKIVARLIEQIKNAEDTLIEGGFDIKERINNDGTFTKIESPVSVEVETKTENTIVNAPKEETKEEDTVANTPVEETKEEVEEETKEGVRTRTPKYEIINNLEDEEEEIKFTKFGVSFREDLIEKIKILCENSKKKKVQKTNDAVVKLLNNIYDDENKDFKIKFEKKSSLKVTSFNLPDHLIKAIERINKKTGVPKSEIFNKLIEESLKDYLK